MLPPKAMWAMGLGFFLTVLEDTDIVDPDGTEVDKNLSDIYGRELTTNPNSLYDIYYELEVAAMMAKDLDNVYPVDDFGADKPSADILYIEDGVEYWLECKNKKDHTAYGWQLEWLGRSIADELFTENGLELGDDSFGIKVSSNDKIQKRYLRDEKIKSNMSRTISRAAYSVIVSEDNDNSVNFRNVTFNVSLKGYHKGRREVYLSDDRMGALNRKVNMFKIFDPLRHVNIGPSIVSSNGHANVYAEKVSDNRIEIFSSYAFEFDIPWDVEYHSWIAETASDVSGQYDRYDNVIAFICAPVGCFFEMCNNDIENHKGQIVTKYQRLHERIGGIFAHPDRDNSFRAVVLSTHCMFDERTEEGRNVRMWPVFDMIPNKNVAEQIPDGILSLINSEENIEEVVSGVASARQY